MHLSNKGANLIKHYESCLKPIGGGRFKAYLDPVKVLTIGWGHTNHLSPKFKSGDVWTQQKCDDVFMGDMKYKEDIVKRLVKVHLNQHQFDALVSFVLNLGQGNLGRSTLLKKVNVKDFAGVPAEFHKWNKAGGRVLAGLTRRRNSEANVFAGKPDQWYKD